MTGLTYKLVSVARQGIKRSVSGKRGFMDRYGDTFQTRPGTGFLQAIFFRGAKSIVKQISFVMLVFLLFLDQISRGQTASGGHPSLPPMEESQGSAEDAGGETG